MKGIRESSEISRPQKRESMVVDISSARADGSAVPVLFSSSMAPTMPPMVPTIPINGGMTTPSPQRRAAQPNLLFDRVALATSRAPAFGGW